MSSIRTRISLDGAWDFQIDPSAGDDVAVIKTWRTAQAPLPWQAVQTSMVGIRIFVSVP